MVFTCFFLISTNIIKPKAKGKENQLIVRGGVPFPCSTNLSILTFNDNPEIRVIDMRLAAKAGRIIFFAPGASFCFFYNVFTEFESLFFKRVKILLTFEPLCISNFIWRITVNKSKKSSVLY